MKKSLLILGLFLSGMAGAQAQCTIQNSCTPTNGYCSTPASGATLPNGQENVPYSTTIQISIASSFSGATITNASVTVNPSLPSGLTATTNPSNGIITGGSDGCVLISGTPATGSAGTYPVQVVILFNTNLGQFPAQLAYTLNISGSTGIAAFMASQGALYFVPNPAGSEVKLNADFHFQNVRIFDALGDLVQSYEANNSTTANLDLSQLNAGIYFVQVSDGNKTVTRKLVKQ